MPTITKVVRPWLKSFSTIKPVEDPIAKENRLAETRPYRTKWWARLRRLQLEKEPLCRHCRANGRLTPATMVDHIKPVKDDGNWRDSDNHQSLCDSCHAKKRQKEGRYHQNRKKS